MRTFSGLPLAVVVAALGVVPRLGAARRVPSALRAAEKLIGQARRNISHTRRSSFRLAPRRLHRHAVHRGRDEAGESRGIGAGGQVAFGDRAAETPPEARRR